MVGHDNEAISQFIKWQKEIKNKIQARPPNQDTRTRTKRLEMVVGVAKPDVLLIRNPENIKTKGSGSEKY